MDLGQKLTIASVWYDIEGVSGKYIVAAKYGFAIMDGSNGKLEYIANAWDDSKEGEGKRQRYTSPST
jgi:hypothetical protein